MVSAICIGDYSNKDIRVENSELFILRPQIVYCIPNWKMLK